MSWRTPLMRGSLLLMESLWVYALGAFFLGVTVGGAPPSFFAAAAVVFVSFAISRALMASDLPLGLVRVWGISLSFLVFYCIVRADYFDLRFWDFTWADDLFNHTEATLRDKASAVMGIPFLWVFWMRGLLRGQQYLGFEPVIASFATGVLVVAFVVLFANTVDMAGGVEFVAVPYIAVGLLTVGLAHAGRSEDDFGHSFAPTWLVAVAGGVLLIAAVASVVSLLDRSRAQSSLETAGKGAGWASAEALYYTSYPVIVGTEYMLRAIGDLLEGALGGQRDDSCLDGVPDQPAATSPNQTGAAQPAPTAVPFRCQQPGDVAQQQGDPKPLPGWLKFALRAAVAVSLIAAIVVGLALVFSRLRKRESAEELRESTYQEGRLAGDLGNFLGTIIGRLRPNLRLGGELEPVRRLYSDLLAAGAQRGVERRRAETPLEVAPRLDRAFASTMPDRITSLFDDTRYGALPPSSQEVQGLREELDRARRGG